MPADADTMKNNKRRGIKVAAVAAALVVAGGAAFAYWTAGGSGSGSATTGTTSTITVNQTGPLTAMGPGVAPQNLSGTFTNPNSGPVYVAAVTASIGAITGGGPTCEATDYTLANPVSDVNAQVPAGAGGTWGLTDTPTIAFNNKPAENQDDCKGATVTINYTVS
jgi:hypothetical protein